MKKKYETPAVFTEDVSVAFVQTCCKDTYTSPTAAFGGMCAINCIIEPSPYSPAG